MASARLAAALFVILCPTPTYAQHLLSKSDPRAKLVGEWILILTVDSTQRLVQIPHGVRSVMDPVTTVTDSGMLQLRDTLITSPRGDELRSTVVFDFQHLLGHPLSCYTGGPGATWVTLHQSQLEFSITPGAADCGFYARAVVRGDSIIGNWGESAFVGSRVTGRVMLVRRSRQVGFVCDWQPRPPDSPTPVVDLMLQSGQTNRLPGPADIEAVRAHGGRILHPFHVAVIRAQVDTAGIRDLVAGPKAVADAAFSVPDTTDLQLHLQLFYSRSITDADLAALRRLGGHDISSRSDLKILDGYFADSVVDQLERLPAVKIVRASAIVCAH